MQEGLIGDEYPDRSASQSFTELPAIGIEVVTMHVSGSTSTHLPEALVPASTWLIPVSRTPRMVEGTTVGENFGAPPRTGQPLVCGPV